MSEQDGIDRETPTVRDGVKTDEGSQQHPIARDAEYTDDAPAEDKAGEPHAGGAGMGDNLPLSGLR